jgi:acetyl-CoA carboxylase biotin carboxylase subunit
MGDKAVARDTATAANVPIVPGSDLISDPALAQKLAEEEIGYPLLVKATGGGGGMGIIVVETPAELAEAIKTAGQIGERTFGNAGIYLEKLLTDVAHVEVQIAGDEHGNVMHLFERNCSVQRRNQKLIEETPAQFMSAEQTDSICNAAVRLAQHVNYNSVGTVEFLFDRIEQKFYFIEMNTRIQVEHPITEMTTGVDLIDTQIRIAAGEKLPDMGLTQAQIKRHGVALEVRVLAEDSHAQTPSPGVISQYEEPTGPDLRVDSGVMVGTEINTYYDSLMAKIIAWGADRETARRHLVRALHLYKVQGISTNIVLLLDILESALFKSGDYNTRILQLLKDGTTDRVFSTADIAALAVALHFGRLQPASVLLTEKDGGASSPSRWWSENHKRILQHRLPKLTKVAK